MTLRRRILQHLRGRIAGLTFRLTMCAALTEQLGLRVRTSPRPATVNRSVIGALDHPIATEGGVGGNPVPHTFTRHHPKVTTPKFVALVRPRAQRTENT
jgi:hypothetical protein